MIPRSGTPVRYVALGDSYTIGTGVSPADRWPAQLVAALGGAIESGSLELVANLAVNGRTSGELIRQALPEVAGLRPRFATVLIGVNDVVRGVPVGVYEANVATILDTLLARQPPDRIVTVGIPDYTVTPRGADYGDPARQRREIVAFNAVMAAASAIRAIRHVEVFDLSSRAASQPSLVADDGLHPSGAQYRLWVERIAPIVADVLRGDRPEVSDRPA
jgi:lysophospholipase L1-like esterase